MDIVTLYAFKSCENFMSQIQEVEKTERALDNKECLGPREKHSQGTTSRKFSLFLHLNPRKFRLIFWSLGKRANYFEFPSRNWHS